MSTQPSTLGGRNQVFFDSLASSGNRQPWMNDLVSQIQTEVIARVDWIGIQEHPSEDTRLLDYACGAGELSRTLFPYVSEAKGIDVSGAMVKAYNDQARAAGVPEQKMCAVVGDMLAVTEGGGDGNRVTDAEWSGFDFAVMSMALHHVAPPEDAVMKLVERLKEGGVLVIVDWDLSSIVFHDAHPKFGPGDHGGHSYGHGQPHAGQTHNVVPGSEQTITRAGFGKEEMEKMFTDAGCEDVGFEEFKEMTRLGDGEQAVMQRLFIAKGKKKGTK
ncbi:MAG: hypothetical protein Q9216_000633 [Gyalolechia sp. 2 TL-2023]